MCVLSGYCRYSVVNYDYAAIRSTSLQASQTVIACYVKVVRTGGTFLVLSFQLKKIEKNTEKFNKNLAYLSNFEQFVKKIPKNIKNFC